MPPDSHAVPWFSATASAPTQVLVAPHLGNCGNGLLTSLSSFFYNVSCTLWPNLSSYVSSWRMSAPFQDIWKLLVFYRTTSKIRYYSLDFLCAFNCIQAFQFISSHTSLCIPHSRKNSFADTPSNIMLDTFSTIINHQSVVRRRQYVNHSSQGSCFHKGNTIWLPCKEISFKVGWLGEEKVRCGCTFADVGGSEIGYVTGKD